MVLEIGPLIGAILVLMLFSWFLYKQTLLYDIAEGVLIGTGAGYSFIMGIKAVRDNAVLPLLRGEVIWIVPILLGLVIYLQLSTETIHFSRIPIAIIIGVGTGLSVRRVLLAEILGQIRASMIDFSALDTVGVINSILILVGTITSIAYFTLSREHTGAFGTFTKIGRIYLMATFGAMFGNGIFGNIAVVAGRIDYILRGFGLL